MWQTDWTLGLVGGGMIGLAAVIFLVVNGRIMGASGILGGLVDGSGRSNWSERAVFIAALVGAGTRIGNGCTSGRGVCGISRFSMRGIVATLFFLFSGGATMLVVRHILGVI